MATRSDINIDLTGESPVYSVATQTDLDEPAPEYWEYSKEYILAIADSVGSHLNIAHSHIAQQMLIYFANKQE